MSAIELPFSSTNSKHSNSDHLVTESPAHSDFSARSSAKNDLRFDCSNRCSPSSTLSKSLIPAELNCPHEETFIDGFSILAFKNESDLLRYSQHSDMERLKNNNNNNPLLGKPTRPRQSVHPKKRHRLRKLDADNAVVDSKVNLPESTVADSNHVPVPQQNGFSPSTTPVAIPDVGSTQSPLKRASVLSNALDSHLTPLSTSFINADGPLPSRTSPDHRSTSGVLSWNKVTRSPRVDQMCMPVLDKSPASTTTTEEIVSTSSSFTRSSGCHMFSVAALTDEGSSSSAKERRPPSSGFATGGDTRPSMNVFPPPPTITLSNRTPFTSPNHITSNGANPKLLLSNLRLAELYSLTMAALATSEANSTADVSKQAHIGRGSPSNHLASNLPPTSQSNMLPGRASVARGFYKNDASTDTGTINRRSKECSTKIYRNITTMTSPDLHPSRVQTSSSLPNKDERSVMHQINGYPFPPLLPPPPPLTAGHVELARSSPSGMRRIPQPPTYDAHQKSMSILRQSSHMQRLIAAQDPSPVSKPVGLKTILAADPLQPDPTSFNTQGPVVHARNQHQRAPISQSVLPPRISMSSSLQPNQFRSGTIRPSRFPLPGACMPQTSSTPHPFRPVHVGKTCARWADTHVRLAYYIQHLRAKVRPPNLTTAHSKQPSSRPIPHPTPMIPTRPLAFGSFVPNTTLLSLQTNPTSVRTEVFCSPMIRTPVNAAASTNPGIDKNAFLNHIFNGILSHLPQNGQHLVANNLPWQSTLQRLYSQQPTGTVDQPQTPAKDLSIKSGATDLSSNRNVIHLEEDSKRRRLDVQPSKSPGRIAMVSPMNPPVNRLPIEVSNSVIPKPQSMPNLPRHHGLNGVRAPGLYANIPKPGQADNVGNYRFNTPPTSLHPW